MNNKNKDTMEKRCQLTIIAIFIIGAVIIILCELFERVITEEFEIGIELVAVFIIGVFIEEKHRRLRKKLKEIKGKYEHLIDTVPDAVYVIDTDGNLKMWNIKLKELTGYTDEELAGMNIAKLLTPESLKIAREKIDYKVKAKKPTSPYEISLKRKDGGIMHIEVISAPLLKDGEVVAIQGFARDITERRKMEEKLKEEEEEYRMLVEMAQEGICIDDENENIVFTNEAFTNLLGYEKEELIGKNIFDIVYEKDRKKLKEESKKRRKGEASRYELRLVAKDGSIKTFIVSATPLYKDGKFIGSLSVNLDITERKKAEEEMKSMLEREREFKRWTAHYFFNPICIAKGYLDMTMEELSEKQRENLQKVLNAIERIEKVVYNIVTKGEVKE
ncbi:MAG TPA: PAS domain S-box protein [Thermoplasmata archaeon]|nr:PAS domain S-box protein [Thermoplasmata archaeon]